MVSNVGASIWFCISSVDPRELLLLRTNKSFEILIKFCALKSKAYMNFNEKDVLARVANTSGANKILLISKLIEGGTVELAKRAGKFQIIVLM